MELLKPGGFSHNWFPAGKFSHLDHHDIAIASDRGLWRGPCNMFMVVSAGDDQCAARGFILPVEAKPTEEGEIYPGLPAKNKSADA
ncbi:MAG TPA: hypothetical protein VKV28_03925 [Candidatus Binataceae bacterium]|nr:hypothetical protein [Candidatus Binataceae bacterium]